MIQLERLSLEFGDRLLFDDVTLTLTSRYRYVLVGANGAGKSSLLSVLSGELEATLGGFEIPKSLKMGWMRQDHHLYDHLSLVEVVLKGRAELWRALEAKEKLLEAVEWTEKHSARLSKLEEQIERQDGYRAEADARTLLTGLGVPEDWQEKPLKTLSGGWKMRVLLAQLLFNQPDILLLDEPTNYLDIRSISWLESYLIDTFQGLVIVVSHDQRFLEKVGTCVLDVDYGTVGCYPGTYSQFLKKKDEIAEQKAGEYANLEEKVKKMQRFIERFRGKPSKAKQCSSRAKVIEKVKWPELGRSSRESPTFLFGQAKKSGQIALKAQGICKLYDPDILIGPLDLELLRGERIAFVGENGAGKTTFIKMLTHQITPDEGEISHGHKIEVALFHQEHKHLFEGNETLQSWVDDHLEVPSEKQRTVLGQVLFREGDMRKKLSMLSGGEMARLLIAKIMLTKANLLVLDEPTNHLDLESKEALANALKQFEGTVLLVSHDRHFIDEVATRVVEISRG